MYYEGRIVSIVYHLSYYFTIAACLRLDTAVPFMIFIYTESSICICFFNGHGV